MSRPIDNSGAGPFRPWVIWLAGLTAVAVLGGAWFYQMSRRPAESPQPEEVAATLPEPGAANPAVEDSELRPLTPEEVAKTPQPPTVVHSASRVTGAAPPATTRVQSTPETQQLIAVLAQLDVSRGAINPEQAEQWKGQLSALKQQGTNAVGAIQEFLEKNLELNFGGVKGGNLLGAPSLRSALINTLAEIGGPEASGVMIQTLQTTALPSEIALLARHLEEQAPAQHRPEIFAAVNNVLALAAKNELPGLDVAPLFQVLQTYGDATTASMLQEVQSRWRYYAAISLAGLPGGDGVPALIRQVQEPVAKSGGREFAMQMLAQMAAQYPEAGATLVEQARANQISDAAWRKIAAGLAGDQFQVGAPERQPNNSSIPGLKTYHVEVGNQNFFSTPLAANAQVSERLALLDQLLRVAANPAAVAALQNARATLAALPN